MGEIMNFPKGLKSGVPERVSMSCPTCDTRDDSPKQLETSHMSELENKPNICVTQVVQKCVNNFP